MTILKTVGASASHVGFALAVQATFLLPFTPLVGGKAALMIGAAFVTAYYIAREIEQIYPHFPRFGLDPLPEDRRPTKTDWMRAARQSLWPSAVTIAIAAYFYLYW